MKKEDLDKAVARGQHMSPVATIDCALEEAQKNPAQNVEVVQYLRGAMKLAEGLVEERNKLAKALLVAKTAMRGNAMRYISRTERIHVEDACELATEGDVQYLNVHGVSLVDPFMDDEGMRLTNPHSQATDTEAVEYWSQYANVDKATVADACMRWRRLNLL